MVGARLDAVDAQQLGDFLHLFARQAVNDAGLAGVLLDVFDHVLLDVLFVAHFVVEVGTVEG